MEPRLKAMVN